jgi:hypothetical protein
VLGTEQFGGVARNAAARDDVEVLYFGVANDLVNGDGMQ